MTNPLLSDWDTPFDLPPFDDITDADFEPAMEAALADARANVAAIADSPDEPTFANTIEALIAGASRLDSTMMGLGRGAGNCPTELLIGTEPAHIYRLVDSGGTERLQAFDDLECQSKWYTPWGGPPAVRSFAHAGNTLYADIHVGSIMRSADRGHSWDSVTAQLDDDVHQVVTCTAAPTRVYANTADAVYVSDDEGQTWPWKLWYFQGPSGYSDLASHPDGRRVMVLFEKDGKSKLGFIILPAPPAVPGV